MGECADECAAGRAVGAEDELHRVSFVGWFGVGWLIFRRLWIASLCFALSLTLSHGERGWVDREAKSGRETKNGSVVAWPMPAILLQRSSEICIGVSTKLAAFVLTSLMLCFQTTLLCLKPWGRGHSPRYFFLVLFRGRVLGRLKAGKAGFMTTAVAWVLPAELTYRFGVVPSP